MAREIRFRAWDIEEKKMWFDVQGAYDFTNMFNVENIPATCFQELLNNHTRYVVMQFTGLLDKSGKEVYEGDICRDKEWGMRSEGIFFNLEKGAFYAWWKYDKPKKGQRTDTFSGGYFNADQASKSEVIGNIYENPELLTKHL